MQGSGLSFLIGVNTWKNYRCEAVRSGPHGEFENTAAFGLELSRQFGY
jgi:hypothetical protein